MPTRRPAEQSASIGNTKPLFTRAPPSGSLPPRRAARRRQGPARPGHTARMGEGSVAGVPSREGLGTEYSQSPNIARSMTIERQARHVLRLIFHCDWCQAHSPGVNTCHCCTRQACSAHGIADERDQGDYPDWYCGECWDKGAPYRAGMNAARSAYELLLDEQERLWKKACES